jgi:hypothetical protein
MFNLDVFYIAVIDGEIAGIAACTDGKVSSVHLKSGICQASCRINFIYI